MFSFPASLKGKLFSSFDDPTSRYYWIAGGAGVAALLFVYQQGTRPNSYPGEALPQQKRLKRRAQFLDKSYPVDAGWRPVVEKQPLDDLLPHRVPGQQIWIFDERATEQDNIGKNEADIPSFKASVNPNSCDAIFREHQLRNSKSTNSKISEPSSALEAARHGFAFYQMLQCDDGQWAGDYGGPHFLLPGFVIAAYITGDYENTLSKANRQAMIAYVRNHQQSDGGWGSHIESPSTVFGSSLMYVSLRLLGVAADDPACVAGRRFLHQHNGVLEAPLWAKFWLAVLGVYELSAIPLPPPELWLLPSWFPLHPGKFWCHARMVYLPMCWLYAKRYTYAAADTDPITISLRSELYPSPMTYDTIPWSYYRHSVAAIDAYSPVPRFITFALDVLSIYEKLGPWRWLRQLSVKFVEQYMDAEDIQTNYLTIGPVSKAFHLLCSWVRAGGSEDAAQASQSQAFRAHVARVPAYLWVAEDGMKVQGYNGSMIWDTSFALQAVTEAGLDQEFPDSCCRGFEFLVREQVRALPDGDWRFWRQPIRGGWGFSTAEQAWPVSDTSAEAFKAVLGLLARPCVERGISIPDEHLFDAVQFLLSYQNADGGWATYENCRGYAWYELLNVTQVFGDIMIDYSYVECSSSAMSALSKFNKLFPHHRATEIAGALAKGAKFIKAMQRRDGSWYGCWGSCFTYGCWFGIEGLLASGESACSCSAIKACIRYLLSHQNSNGGWGEDFASCYNRAYTNVPPGYAGCEDCSCVVQTSWALLALMAGECEDLDALERGIRFLMQRQLPSGDWPQENICGVFNRSIGITYTAFRNVFPIWALGRYAQKYSPPRGGK